MSYYDDDRRDDHRHSRRGPPPAYEEEEIIAARRGPSNGSRNDRKSTKNRRRDSSESSIEEVRRSFPPRGYDDRRDPPRRARSARDSRRRGYDDYDDGYGGDRKRRNRRRDYSSSSSSRSPPPRRSDRRKSFSDQALALGGAGATALAAKAFGDKNKDRDRRRGSSRDRDRRSRRYSSSSSSDRSRHRSSRKRDPQAEIRDKLLQAAKAAALAGGTEAWRQRKEPGDWKGPKGKRVLTAAVGAAGVDGILDKDPDKKGGIHTLTAAAAGLLGNRAIHGSREEERSRSRSRVRTRDNSRERRKSTNPLEALGGAGAIAGLATKAFQEYQGNKQAAAGGGGRRGRRSYSSSSDDSRVYGRRRRAKSVSDYVRGGLGKLGIGSNKDERDTIDRGSLSPPRTRSFDPNHAAAPQQHVPIARPRGGGAEGTMVRQRRNYSSSDSSGSSSTTSSDTEKEEKEKKKIGRKQLITAGLASVATIHAAHEIYETMHKDKQDEKEVAEGDISVKEADRRRHKRKFRQAAAIGVAALGVRGAYSEWKEVNEQRHEAKELREKMKKRHDEKLLKDHGIVVTPNGSEHYVGPDYVHAGGAAGGHVRPHGPIPPGHVVPAIPQSPTQLQHRHSTPHLAGPNSYYPGEELGPPGPHYTDGNPFAMGGGLPHEYH